MTLQELNLEISDLQWEEWMISVSEPNPKRISEIKDRLAYLNNVVRNGFGGNNG